MGVLRVAVVKAKQEADLRWDPMQEWRFRVLVGYSLASPRGGKQTMTHSLIRQVCSSRVYHLICIGICVKIQNFNTTKTIGIVVMICYS